MLNINDRVALILRNDIKSETEKICYFLGYATYIGRTLVSDKNRLYRKVWNSTKNKYDKFKLPVKEYITFKKDNGDLLYEFDCWLLSEERFKKAFIEDKYKEGWKVINVNLNGEEIN